MKIIKLSQQATIERQGKYGWEPETVFEPVFVAVGYIVIMTLHGITTLKYPLASISTLKRHLKKLSI